MNKKNCILVIALAIFMLPLIAFADTTTTNQFGVDVTAGDIPGPTPPPPTGGGTNATGIAVGVGAGTAAAAGAAALLAPSLLPGLLLGAAAGVDAPLCPVCLCDGTVVQELQACAEKFCYILKAIAMNCLHNPCNSKYILVTDTTIQPGAYNVVTLKLPKELAQCNKPLNVKITQISNPFSISKNRPDLNSRLYINSNLADVTKLYKNQRYWRVNEKNGEVAYNIKQAQGKCGTLVKFGQICPAQCAKDCAVLVTAYHMNGRKSRLPRGAKSNCCQRYAVLIEFSNLDLATLLK